MAMIGLQDVLTGTGGVTLIGGVPADPAAMIFAAVEIDSRAIVPGDLFVAVRGETHDGHRFVADAAARGAAGALIAAGGLRSSPNSRQPGWSWSRLTIP